MILQRIVRTVIKTTLLLGKQMQKKRIVLKKTVFVSMLVAVLGIAPMGTAYAAINCSAQPCIIDAPEIKATNCRTFMSGVQYGNYCLFSCGICDDNFTLVVKIENLTGCNRSYNDCAEDRDDGDDDDDEGDGGIIIDGCFKDSQCTDGVGTTNITGGTKTVTGDCVDGVCEYTTSVSCNANYYKSGSSCSECPDVGGVNGLSSGGTSGITSCYIPMNTKINGTNGKYVFQGADCYYSRTIKPGGVTEVFP